MCRAPRPGVPGARSHRGAFRAAVTPGPGAVGAATVHAQARRRRQCTGDPTAHAAPGDVARASAPRHA